MIVTENTTDAQIWEDVADAVADIQQYVKGLDKLFWVENVGSVLTDLAKNVNQLEELANVMVDYRKVLRTNKDDAKKYLRNLETIQDLSQTPNLRIYSWLYEEARH
jgi:hypothetical protein